MGSPWERIMTLDMAGEVSEQLKWDRRASAVYSGKYARDGEMPTIKV
jgi:hypothetical protein